MTRSIPDIHLAGREVTLEHCDVLVERLTQTLAMAYPEDDFEFMNRHFNPRWLRESLLEMFTEKAFLKLFETDMGKGVLIGSFIQAEIFDQEEE